MNFLSRAFSWHNNIAVDFFIRIKAFRSHESIFYGIFPFILFIFSGGIFCDAVGILCGGTAIGVSGAIYREGHTYVLTHGVTADNAAGSLGFKLSYTQLPCSGASTSYTTGDA